MYMTSMHSRTVWSRITTLVSVSSGYRASCMGLSGQHCILKSGMLQYHWSFVPGQGEAYSPCLLPLAVLSHNCTRYWLLSGLPAAICITEIYQFLFIVPGFENNHADCHTGSTAITALKLIGWLMWAFVMCLCTNGMVSISCSCTQYQWPTS